MSHSLSLKMVLNWSALLTLCLLVTCHSFKNPSSGLDHVGRARTDTVAFPFAKFSSVTLLSADSLCRNTPHCYDSFAVEGGGISFVNDSGKPRIKAYKSFGLNDSEMNQLETFLVKKPCLDSVHLDKACAPIYRDVFLFKDEKGNLIGQVQICFDCELSLFSPYDESMCDFDNKVNYGQLRLFVDSIKDAK